MNLTSRHKAYFVLLLALGLAACRFAPLLDLSGEAALEPWSEGYKAYSVVQYHIMHDSTWSHFEGMNYPYGEHVIPAGTQPLVSGTLRALNLMTPVAPGTVFTVLHYLMILGLALSIFFLYLLLRRLGLPFWYSLGVAVGISFLSPQLLRYPMHFGLAHPEVIPIVLYCLYRYEQVPGTKNALWVALPVFLFSGIHFYFLAILGALIGLYFLLRWLRSRDWSLVPQTIGHLFLAFGLPALLWYGWLILTDPVGDRTDFPWGFFEYRALPAGLFTSVDLPHYELFSKDVRQTLEVGLEARNYLGLIGGIALLCFCIQIVRRWFRTGIVRPPGTGELFLRQLLAISLILLIFALGIPFIIPAFERGIRWLGPLGQFRSIGRFTWILFYVVNLLAFYRFWQLISVRSRKSRILLASLLLSGLLAEAYLFSNAPVVRNLEPREVIDWTDDHKLVDQLPFRAADFQALIPLPYFNIGSDQYWFPIRGGVGQKSLTYSVQTGLPITGAMLTRTSFGQTVNQLQLVAEPYRSYRILKDVKGKRPFLVLVDESAWNPENDYGGWLVNEATLLFRSEDGFAWYRLAFSDLQDLPKRRAAELSDEINSVRWYAQPEGNLFADDSLGSVYYYSFDDAEYQPAYRGPGGLPVAATNRIRILEQAVDYPAGTTILLSFWFLSGVDLAPRTSLHIRETDPESGSELQVIRTHVFDRTQTFDNNGWALVEIPIQLRGEKSLISLNVRHQMFTGKLMFDEFLLRPENVNVYRILEEGFWYNNRWFDLPERK